MAFFTTSSALRFSARAALSTSASRDSGTFTFPAIAMPHFTFFPETRAAAIFIPGRRNNRAICQIRKPAQQRFREFRRVGYTLDSGNRFASSLVGRSPWTARDALVPLPEAEAPGHRHGVVEDKRLTDVLRRSTPDREASQRDPFA